MVNNSVNKEKSKQNLALKVGKVKRWRDEGKTPEEISTLTNMSMEIVRRCIGIIERAEIRESKAKAMREAGYSCAEIAKTLNMPESLVRKSFSRV